MMRFPRTVLFAILCVLVFSPALPLPAPHLEAAARSVARSPSEPAAQPAEALLAVFDPITHTVLPGGHYNYDAWIIRPGIVVTFTGALSASVSGDLSIAGKLVGDCWPLELHVQGDITLTGTVDNHCSDPAAQPADLTIYTYGGDMRIGTAETPAELFSSGSTYLSNDPTLPDWEFDVLPQERSAAPLAPVCAATADTLVDTAYVSPTLGVVVALDGEGADPDGGPVSYAWDLGDGGTSTEMSPVYTYTTWGTYDVVLTVTDDEGDTCQATLRIVLDDGEANFPEAPAVNAAPAVLVVPADQAAYFYAAALDPQGEQLTYRWDLGDGGVSTATSPIYTYAGPGRYEVALVVTDTAGLTSTARSAIYVFPSYTTFLPLLFRAGASRLLAGRAVVSQANCLAPDFNFRDIKPPAAPGRKGADLIYRGRGDIVLGGGMDLRAGDGGDGVDRAGSGTVRGGDAGRGGSLHILVAGRLTICGGAYLASGNGGVGGDATSNTPPPGTARAIGGKGGPAGHFLSIKASGGVTFDSPFGNPVVINPGCGGDGGSATATGGAGAAGGCLGQPGAAAEARGGNGGKSSKIGRGGAAGLGNLEVTGGWGGFGGTAWAFGGDGGDAACPGSATGGAGRPAQARGGVGGRAEYAGAFQGNLSTAAFTAGYGGDAWAVGGVGGAATASAPGPCGDAAAFGGSAAAAAAYGGKGGAGHIPGDGGDATAVGGDGGSAGATGGDCLPCLAGGGGSATGGPGADALARFGERGGPTAADGIAAAFGGSGGGAGATGGRGGDCAACPAGAGGAGGPAQATGGNGGNAFGNGTLTGGNGGGADALGGQGGVGATCCNPPQPGGDGGRGGDATSTAGSPGNPPGNFGVNGIKGGDGGAGGDGEPTAGAGGPPGLGTGLPVDIPDGQPGQPGGPCACTPPTSGRIDWQPPEPTAGSVITFTGSASGTLPMTFTWDFGDGTPAQGGNPVKHVYEAPGEYETEMVAMNLCGNTVVTAVVAVKPSSCIPPHDTAVTWAPAEPVVGEPVTFVGYSTGTLPMMYWWNFGDGITATGRLVTHTFEMPAGYDVTLVAHNACGMESYTARVVVLPPFLGGGWAALFTPVPYQQPYLPLVWPQWRAKVD